MGELDEITLRGLRAFGYHGVYPHERREGQVFVVDLTLFVDTRAAAASDDVADTAHYGDVAVAATEIIAGEPVNLIETLGARIAERALSFTGVRAVAVTVHKPDAPITVPFEDVTVTIRRERESA
ncbi:dihydroneopterin aldolase [Microbacterium elymi]|uniref:7,8-dihydroneopterin aldolase n=2 Tax=Microbacterium elymi TaxID=2909587 RepID=A0ABY5NNB5_9MICO|nr:MULTISPECIES: dihydroneopterin aldolase [Microbacterium]UUT36640.1 dihydroneopterin aldolase [Microbacterium elymi]